MMIQKCMCLYACIYIHTHIGFQKKEQIYSAQTNKNGKSFLLNVFTDTPQSLKCQTGITEYGLSENS